MDIKQWLWGHPDRIDRVLETAIRAVLSMLFSLLFLELIIGAFLYGIDHPIDTSVGLFYLLMFSVAIGIALLLNYILSIRIDTGIVFAGCVMFTALFHFNVGIFVGLLALIMVVLWNKAMKYPVYIPSSLMAILMTPVMIVHLFGSVSDAQLQKAKFFYAVLFGDPSALGQ